MDQQQQDNNNNISNQRNKEHSIQRSNSFPGAMITHVAADGGKCGMLITPYSPSDHLSSNLLRKDIVSNNDSISTSIKKIRWTVFAIVVLLGGGFIIYKEDLLHTPVITGRVMPELQHRLELFEARMLEGVEMAKLMAPNFNETLYWTRLSNIYDKSSNNARTTATTTQERLRPGFQLAQKNPGSKGKYPVVMVPGFVTSGLEVWKGKSCMGNFFRERIWGGYTSAQYWLRSRNCVMENLALDPTTGGDPPDVKLRSSQGFQAADFFVGNDWIWGGYWVWSKILENLADLDYDSSTMTMEAYDWRLGMKILEDRDHYFTHLKHKIEAHHETAGQKVVLTSHSMGAIVVHYFFAWVTEEETHGGGGGGKKWVDKHIHAFVNIAGAQLGVMKATSALMSGEMSDTVFMGGIGSVVERLIPRKARKELWSTWGSLWAMLPKGGDHIWSIGADLPETAPINENDTQTESAIPSRYHEAIKKQLFVMTDSEDDDTVDGAKDPIECNINDLLDPTTEPIVNKALNEFSSRIGHTTQQAIDFLLKWGGGMGPFISPVRLYSFNLRNREKPSHRTWHDSTQTPLPYAPNMKIYCMYGVGVDTERAYFYKRNPGEQGLFADDNSSEGGNTHVVDPPFILDTSIEDVKNKIVHGIKYSDGDGSVPLLSLGYMCSGPWRNKKSGLNPSGSKVIVREYGHRTEFTVDDPMRKGPHSTEHVDILGNVEMLQDYMKIVSDQDVDSLKDNILSDIEGIVKRIDEHPDGGLQKPKRRWFH